MKYEILDRQPRWHTIQRDINMLTSEIMRLTRMPYSSWENKAKMISLDKQIIYLEELLSHYEHDQKKDFE